MRKLLMSAAVLAAVAILCGSVARAERLALSSSDCDCQPADCWECDACGGGHGLFGGGHGHHGHRGRYEGRTAHFNCGCNGSYKFPVPPLSTYHWPGMWSHQLMTDYHSPWRFPPLKPYVDEFLPVEMGSDEYLPREIHQASAESPVLQSSDSFSFSRRLLEMSR
jgi:hypothetical protein